MMPNTDVLHDLEPTVERLLERHLASSKEWFPHEYVPYSRGRDHEQGETWSEDDADLAGATIDDAVRSALLVNLLTEDNLPYYFRSVERMFGPDGAWGTWVRRWTAEEGRHSMAIYGYLMVTRAIDPHQLERGRMAQVSAGITPDPPTLQHGFVYLALQELATRIAHRSTGRMIGDPAGYEVMMRVASDENLHQLFYRDLAEAAIEHDPSGMMCAIEHEVAGFQMPGIGIPDFNQHAGADRPGRDLRPRRAPRADPRAGRAAPVERRERHRSRRRRRAGPRTTDEAAGQERARRPPRRRAPRVLPSPPPESRFCLRHWQPRAV